MKQFKNLQEAFDYRTLCPFCEKQISVGWHSVSFEEGGNHTVTLVTGSTSFRIGMTDNIVYQMSDPSIMKGTFMFSVVSVCGHCAKYSHVLQVHVEIGPMRMIGCFLNSELIHVEDNSRRYEINNVYATEKTKMITYHTKLSQSHPPLDSVEMPLIPLDMKDPMKTVERIKSLLVFL